MAPRKSNPRREPKSVLSMGAEAEKRLKELEGVGVNLDEAKHSDKESLAHSVTGSHTENLEGQPLLVSPYTDEKSMSAFEYLLSLPHVFDADIAAGVKAIYHQTKRRLNVINLEGVSCTADSDSSKRKHEEGTAIVTQQEIPAYAQGDEDDIIEETQIKIPYTQMGELPPLDLLVGHEDLLKRLQGSSIFRDLGYVDPAELLKCKVRSVTTMCGTVEVSVYTQYIIRVLQVYYKERAYPADTPTICSFLELILSKDELNLSNHFKVGYNWLKEVGYLELYNKLKPALWSATESREARYDNTVTSIDELKQIYPDSEVLLKILNLCADNLISHLEPVVIGLNYNEEYVEYLNLFCQGTKTLDGAVVSLSSLVSVPKSVDANTASFEIVTQAKDKQVPAPPGKIVTFSHSSKKSPLTAGVPTTSMTAQVGVQPGKQIGGQELPKSLDIIDIEMGESEDRYWPQLEVQDRIINLEKAFIEQKGMFDRLLGVVEKNRIGVCECKAGMDVIMTRQETSMLGGQQKMNKSLLASEGVAAGKNVQVSSKSTPMVPKEQSSLPPAEAISVDEAVRRLVNYQNLPGKTQHSLFQSIKNLLGRAGRYDLLMNLAEKHMGNPMYRSRLIDAVRGLGVAE